MWWQTEPVDLVQLTVVPPEVVMVEVKTVVIVVVRVPLVLTDVEVPVLTVVLTKKKADGKLTKVVEKSAIWLSMLTE